MPIKFLKPLNDEQKKIWLRFQADIERIAMDLESQVSIVKIGKTEKDVPYVTIQTDRIFSDNADRVNLMADSLTWQAYQLGNAQAIFEQTDLVTWNLDPTAEHCDTCIGYATIRYFTKETLPGLPGSAPTECDGGCKCYLT